MQKKGARARPQIIYAPPPSAIDLAMDDALEYMIPCPICKKRTIDVSELPERLIRLRYKCPHCRNIVTTPLVATLGR